MDSRGIRGFGEHRKVETRQEKKGRDGAPTRFFRVLGDPTRLKILEFLTVEERTVGGAAEALTPIAERLATCTRIGPDWV